MPVSVLSAARAGGQRLFEPEHVELAERFRQAPYLVTLERRADVSGHAPALVHVDDDRHRVSDCLANGGDGRNAVVKPVGDQAQLEGAEALLSEGKRILGAPLRGTKLAGRRIEGDSPDGAAEQLHDRSALCLAHHIPEGNLEGPVAAGVEGDRLEHPYVTLELTRILPDEEVLVAAEPIHGVARAEARDPLIGLDDDERGLE
jgi:hypothetical protein